MKERKHKFGVLAFWLGTVTLFWWLAGQRGLTLLGLIQLIIEVVSERWYGPLLYILVYALRPLILMPSTFLTIAGGYLYGFWGGLALTIVGSNVSASVDYFVGRYFGHGFFDEAHIPAFLDKHVGRLRQNSFTAVLLMRLLFLPYDTVSIFVGVLQAEWVGFALGTAVGNIPGSLSFVMFGAAIEGEFTGEIPTVNGWMLVMSFSLFFVSYAVSRYLRKHEKPTDSVSEPPL